MWRRQWGVIVNAHIPQHEGRGKEIVGGEGGNDVAVSNWIVTQVIGVMISHMSLN
jgi:hypothetical protein